MIVSYFAKFCVEQVRCTPAFKESTQSESEEEDAPCNWKPKRAGGTILKTDEADCAEVQHDGTEEDPAVTTQ